MTSTGRKAQVKYYTEQLKRVHQLFSSVGPEKATWRFGIRLLGGGEGEWLKFLY